MFLRIFLLIALAIVLALFVRAFMLRARLHQNLKDEEDKMRDYLQQILAEHADKMRTKSEQSIIACSGCGVCVPEKDGVYDAEGRFFCSQAHLESFQHEVKK